MWISTDEADASALAPFPAELESGIWHRKTWRNKIGVSRGRSVAGVEESWKQRTLSSGGRDIGIQHSFSRSLQILNWECGLGYGLHLVRVLNWATSRLYRNHEDWDMNS